MSLRSLAAWKKPLVVSLLFFLIGTNLLTMFAPTAHAQDGGRAADAAAALIGSEARPSDSAAIRMASEAAASSSAVSTSDACTGSGVFGPFLGFICSGMTLVLGLIVELLGKLVTLILSILLAFAKYNAFASAAPVQVGWPIVRDICNMFFIIVLLVSAFATIIDQAQSDLHYTKVLPRLLAMAVLINFSKTLIQLLIDFSQVVMLTFVNAFAASASGNFVNALGLTTIMQLDTSVPAGTANMANIIISYMLAIFMLGIMISVVSLLTRFLIFRIVGLWIALIFSPLAFFVTAVPGRLAKGLGSIASDYWGRLGSLLSGGPIIAFFLWLTLAIVQQANSGAAGQGLSQVLDFEVEGPVQVFLTSIGNAQSIASFVVGITLLMMGLDQAVKTSGQISSTLGAFASKAKSAGTSLGRLGALAPFLAAGYGARAGARAVDQRFDVTRRASALGLKTVGRVPGVGSAVRPTLARGLTMRREEAAAQAAQEAKLVGNVAKFGTDQEQKMVGKTYSMSGSAFRTLGARSGSMKVAEILATDKIRDREIKKNEESYVDRLKASGMSEAEAKNGSKVLAEKDAYREQMGFIQNQIELARGLGDLDKVEDLEKAIRINPYMASDKDRQSQIDKLATDPEKYKDINKQDAMSGDLLTGFMQKHGWETNAAGELAIKDTAAYDRLKESVQKSGNKSLLEGLEAHETFVVNSPGLKTSEATQLQHRKNSADGMIQSFSVARENGEWQKDSSGNLKAGTRVQTKNYTKSLADLESATAARKSSGDTVPRDVIPQNNIANAKLADSFISNNGTLTDYLAKAKSSDVDTLPIQTIQYQVFNGAESGIAALNTGDSIKANETLKPVSRILAQIDQQGISDTMQSDIIESFSTGLRDVSGKINTSFVRNIDKLTPQIRDSLVKTLETAKKRADDILQNVAKDKMTEAQKEVVAFSDAVSKEIDINRKNINSRILNAYRPGRDRASGNT
ncbi:hypothetical protein IPH19_00580 [Candidatus Uhrbacteria bacterium]|nr:MAG: hypothetical protein IPH19_00580 [Candidatus Uhrbacteria bacterium]